MQGPLQQRGGVPAMPAMPTGNRETVMNVSIDIVGSRSPARLSGALIDG
ncbi:hypothetical protein LJR031_007371 [Caballeronia sp. LjRoot31]